MLFYIILVINFNIMKQKGFDNNNFSIDLDDIFGLQSTQLQSGGQSSSGSDKIPSNKPYSNPYFENQNNQQRHHQQQSKPNQGYYNYPIQYQQSTMSMGNFPYVTNSYYTYGGNQMYFQNNNFGPNPQSNTFIPMSVYGEFKESKPPFKAKKKKKTTKASDSDHIKIFDHEEETKKEISKKQDRSNHDISHQQNTLLSDDIENLEIKNDNKDENTLLDPELLLLLSATSFQKKKKCLKIQQFIESINDPDMIKEIYTRLATKDLQRISRGKFSNYFTQTLLSKLDIEELKNAWKELSKYDVMLNEFGNRVLQVLVDQLISKNQLLIVTGKLRQMISILSYDQYGIFVLQSLFVSDAKTSEIAFLIDYINDFFYSHAFNINGVVLIKKYLLFLKRRNEEESIKNVYIQKIRPFVYFLLHEKYSSYLLLMVIEEFTFICEDLFDHIEVEKIMLSEYSSSVLQKLIELSHKVSLNLMYYRINCLKK